MTLMDALTAFGDFTLTNGKPPTGDEFRDALGLSSASVADRWLRVLEGENLLEQRKALYGYEITPEGYEYLYRQHRTQYLSELS